jgi:retron-type reverse transcriptase
MAKTYKNLYPQVFEFSNLYNAYLLARRGKRYRKEVLVFTRDLEENLIQLQNELIWKSYKTGRYREFYVYEPKKRVVAALPFRDRVVQHALVSVIEPIWERRFIFDSYACRPGKGTHAGVNRAQRFMRAVKRRHGKVYVLKADISKYFSNIDHNILRRLLKKRIVCGDTLQLLGNIIESTPGQAGIPIVNLTSQLFANIYLHELDEYVKYTCRVRYYARYMDDFIIVHHDKAYLQNCRYELERFLWSRLRLRTNAKTQVFPVALVRGRGLDFLGYKIWPSHKKIKKSSIKRMRKRLKKLQRDYAIGKIGLSAIKPRLMSWLGHAKHADAGSGLHILTNAVFKRAL